MIYTVKKHLNNRPVAAGLRRGMCFSFLVFAILPILLGGTIAADGVRPTNWTDLGLFVCKIDNIKANTTPSKMEFDILESIYTDVPVKTTFEANYATLESQLGSISDFKAGDVVIVFITKNKDGEFYVETNGNSLLPSRNGISKIDGVDDKIVGEIANEGCRLRKNGG
jgi:hypothetical protein